MKAILGILCRLEGGRRSDWECDIASVVGRFCRSCWTQKGYHVPTLPTTAWTAADGALLNGGMNAVE
jgi:hypothetical protein